MLRQYHTVCVGKLGNPPPKKNLSQGSVLTENRIGHFPNTSHVFTSWTTLFLPKVFDKYPIWFPAKCQTFPESEVRGHSGLYEKFWDITPCSTVNANRCFADICPLHLQCPSVIIYHATRRDMFPRNVGWYPTEDIPLLFQMKFTYAIQSVQQRSGRRVATTDALHKKPVMSSDLKLRDMSPWANYTDRATATCRRS
jgi:hypothetical protein